MSSLVKITNGEPASIVAIRRAHPNISLPRNPSDDTLAALGYARIHPTPRPSGDVVTQGQPEQRDGQWYQTWEVRDFTPEELEQHRQASIPQSITPRQARLALLGADLLDQVATALDSLPGPEREAAQIEWEYATTIDRDSAWIDSLGSALGLSETEIDELFVAASGL